MPKEQHTPAGGLREQFKREVMRHVDDLLEHHWEGMIAILEEAEVKKVKASFGATLDCSDTASTIDVVMSYSQVVKDKRTTTLEDPNQTALPFPGTETANTAEAEEGGPLEEEDGEGPVEAHKRRRRA